MLFKIISEKEKKFSKTISKYKVRFYQKIIYSLVSRHLLHLNVDEQALFLGKLAFINSEFDDFLKSGSRLFSLKNSGTIDHNVKYRKLLQGKTQVRSGHNTDVPDRATHTNQVRNLVKEILQPLGLNVFLGEAVAMAHDIGHCAFGHAGERTLDEFFASVLGGFNHKLAGAYIAKYLLNLPDEIVEGIALHSGGADVVLIEQGCMSSGRREYLSRLDLNKEGLLFVKEKNNQATHLETAIVSILDDIDNISTDIEVAFKLNEVNALDLPFSFKKLSKELAPDRNPLSVSENDVKAAFLDIVMQDLKQNAKESFGKGVKKIYLSKHVIDMVNDMQAYAGKNIYYTKSQKEIDEATKIIMLSVCTFIAKYKYNNFEDLKPEEHKEKAVRMLIEDILTKDDKDMFEIFKLLKNKKHSAKKLAKYIGIDVKVLKDNEKTYSDDVYNNVVNVLKKHNVSF